MIPKPARIFARDMEWDELARFVSATSAAPRLGVVSGRRRQGKTYLLESLVEATSGLYFGATEATETESLAMFVEALRQHVGDQVPSAFVNWDDAIRFLFSVGADIGPVVIDEFPFLSKASPALPSIIQREIDRAVSRESRINLLLCGSAMSVMGKLLAGSAPLRGRASLELVVRPFDHILAARFWGISDPRLAAMVHAVVGGTPAYMRFVDGDAPADVADFDDWVCRTALRPARPLFREARYLLEEETDVRDTALYHSALAAVAHGNNTRGGIANYIGRKSADIGHHLNVLEDSGLLRREQDILRPGRSTYRVAEPLVVFYHVVMRPQWGLLESGRAENVWRTARPRFHAQVLGPHFEQLCRDYVMSVGFDRFGELASEVGSGVVPDPVRRSQIEVDVVVLAAPEPGKPRRVLSLGEAKWGEVIGRRQVDLRRARDLLSGQGFDMSQTVLACYSGAGFEQDLAGDVVTIGLDDLYRTR